MYKNNNNGQQSTTQKRQQCKQISDKTADFAVD